MAASASLRSTRRRNSGSGISLARERDDRPGGQQHNGERTREQGQQAADAGERRRVQEQEQQAGDEGAQRGGAQRWEEVFPHTSEGTARAPHGEAGGGTSLSGAPGSVGTSASGSSGITGAPSPGTLPAFSGRTITVRPSSRR